MNLSILQLIFLVLSCLNLSSYADTNSFLSCLYTKKIPNSIIYTAQSQNYTSVLQDYIRNGRFNTSTTPKPTLILTPFDESHVQVLVRCARATGMHLRIRSGGHDYEGLSYVSKGAPFAILDMFNFRSVQVDVKNATALVGSGAILGELYYRIWEKSKVHAFPAGVCPTVGLGGHLSGGGYGNLMRKYGVSVDNIVDARIVDAEGRILDREAMGEDLFWAIRGGGGASFAVVLSYKLNLVAVPPLVTIFDISKNLKQNATGILHRWQYVAPKFDKELFVRVNLASVEKVGATVTFLAMYLGDSEKLVSVMAAQFPELGVTKQDCKEMPWIDAVLYWAEFPAKTPETALLARDPGPTTFKIKSDYVTEPIPVSGVEGLLQRIEAAGTSFFVKFNPYGGRMSEIPGSAVAFPHREGNMYKIQYFHLWNETGAAAEAYHLKIVRDMYDYMTPFVSKNPRRAYLNYRDIEIGSSSEGGADGFKAAEVYGIKYFGKNLERLIRIKTAVDPTDFFRHEQSIHPLPRIQ